MGAFDQMLKQLDDYADKMGIELSDAEASLEGRTLVVTGDVDSAEGKTKLAAFLKSAGSKAGISIVERLTVVDDEDEDDNDDEEDDDDEDYDDDEEDDDDDDEDDEEDQEYTVQRGDSFWKIAEEFYGDGTKYKILQEYNESEHLHPGDIVYIPSLRNYIDTLKLQVMLTVMGYNAGPLDGVIGAKTTAALRDFQRDNDLRTSGKLDDDTVPSLRESFYAAEDIPVKPLQIMLKDVGYNPGGTDGIMGANTKRALKEFQADNDLADNGQLDDETISALLESYA